MRRFHTVVLAAVLILAFIAGFLATPTASATGQVCWYILCHGGEQVRCCEGQICVCPPQCSGDPPVCW